MGVVDEDEVADPDGELVVLDDEAAGGVEGDDVDELDEVSLLPGDVVVELDEVLPLLGVDVDEDEEAGGVGGTTTVDELELGGVERVVSEGVCCWQAPSASSTLAATAVIVRRVIDRLLRSGCEKKGRSSQ